MRLLLITSLVALLTPSFIISEPIFFGGFKRRPRCRPLIKYQTIYQTEYVQVPDYQTVYETKYQPTTVYQDRYQTVEKVVYSTIVHPQYNTKYSTINNPVYITSTYYEPVYVTRTTHRKDYRTKTNYKTVYSTIIQPQYITTTHYSSVYHTYTNTQYNQQYVTVTQPRQTYITNCQEPIEKFTYSFFEPAPEPPQPLYQPAKEDTPYFDEIPNVVSEAPYLTTSYDSFSPTVKYESLFNENTPSPPYYLPSVTYDNNILPGFPYLPEERDNFKQNRQGEEYNENLYEIDSSPPVYNPNPEDQASYLYTPSIQESYEEPYNQQFKRQTQKLQIKKESIKKKNITIKIGMPVVEPLTETKLLNDAGLTHTSSTVPKTS